MKELKTVDIKGKSYVMIHERIKYFRENEKFKGWSMQAEIVSHNNGCILIKAYIFDSNASLIATGFAQEKEGDGFINKTSYVENCETSAWGRALGNLGIGIDSSIASADEVKNAQTNQSKKEIMPNTNEWNDSIKYLNDGGNIPTIRKKYFLSAENEAKLMEDCVS